MSLEAEAGSAGHEANLVAPLSRFSPAFFYFLNFKLCLLDYSCKLRIRSRSFSDDRFFSFHELFQLHSFFFTLPRRCR